MSGLARRQQEFLSALLDEQAPLPAGWQVRHARGLAIYRNNYRGGLIDTLRDTYPRTEVLAGEAAFARAAAHHCITHPPSSWTLDQVGAGFSATCAELFRDDPDVAELAALEWAMQEAFVARDAVPLDASAFAAATAHWDEDGWDGLKLVFVASMHLLRTSRDLPRMWHKLGNGESDCEADCLTEPHSVIVWRESERPVFVLRPPWEGEALAAFREGAGFGRVCGALAAKFGEERAVTEAGAMLARWIGDGLVERVDQ